MVEKGYLAISESARHTSELRLSADIKYRWQFYCPTTWPISNLYRYFYSIYCEIRFKLISQLAKEFNPDVIIELASGLSPRGLIMAEERVSLIYFDSDLPEIIDYKKSIFSRYGLNRPQNLLLAVKDLKGEEIDFVIQKKADKIILISEGLLPWLTQKGAKEIHQKIERFAQKHGQAQIFWLTDINLVFKDLDPEEEKINRLIKIERQRLGEKIDQPVVSEPFEDMEAFKKALELGERGAKIYRTKDLVDEISSRKINADLIELSEIKATISRLISKKAAIVAVEIN